jgi:hypothetical protein
MRHTVLSYLGMIAFCGLRSIEDALVTEEAAPVRRACVSFFAWRLSIIRSPCHRFECFGRADSCARRRLGN